LDTYVKQNEINSNELLCEAVKEKNEKKVIYILETYTNSIDLNYQICENTTVLIRICAGLRINILEKIVELFKKIPFISEKELYVQDSSGLITLKYNPLNVILLRCTSENTRYYDVIEKCVKIILKNSSITHTTLHNIKIFFEHNLCTEYKKIYTMIDDHAKNMYPIYDLYNECCKCKHCYDDYNDINLMAYNIIDKYEQQIIDGTELININTLLRILCYLGNKKLLEKIIQIFKKHISINSKNYGFDKTNCSIIESIDPCYMHFYDTSNHNLFTGIIIGDKQEIYSLFNPCYVLILSEFNCIDLQDVLKTIENNLPILSLGDLNLLVDYYEYKSECKIPIEHENFVYRIKLINESKIKHNITNVFEGDFIRSLKNKYV